MKLYIECTENPDMIYFYIREYKNDVDISDYTTASIRNINMISKAEFDKDPRYHVYVVYGNKADYDDLKQATDIDSDFISQYNLIIPDDGFDSDFVSEDDKEYYMKQYNNRKDKENEMGLQRSYSRNYRI